MDELVSMLSEVGSNGCAACGHPLEDSWRQATLQRCLTTTVRVLR